MTGDESLTPSDDARGADRDAGQPVSTGYTLVLPPGWARITLREEGRTETDLRHALDRAFAGYGRDEVAVYRRDAEQQLRAQVAAARKAEGLDLYLPVQLTHGMAIPASLVLSEGRFDTMQKLDAIEMVATLASAPGAEVDYVDGSPAARVVQIVAPDPAQDVPVVSTRVEYTFPVPGDPNRWLVAAFSVLDTGELAELLVDLFAAMMGTFRWRRTAADPDSGD